MNFDLSNLSDEVVFYSNEEFFFSFAEKCLVSDESPMYL